MKGRSGTIDFKLYLITDRKLFTDKESLFIAVEAALKGGVKALQLREKDLPIRELLDMAYTMRDLTKKYGALLFINDRVDIALAVNADGIHLGESGMPAYAVREVVGDEIRIGVSTHSAAEAKRAELNGADFVTLGPIYNTPSKMHYGKPLGLGVLEETKMKISIPIFAIGGIKLDNIDEVMKSGAFGIALISGILASETITSEAEAFMRTIK